MINNLKDLKRYLQSEKTLYLPGWGGGVKAEIVRYVAYDKDIALWRYVVLLRKTEYFYNNKKITPMHGLLYLFYRRRKNKMGEKLGIEMWENSFDEGLRIHHWGNIVVNGKARIGKNCQLHGSNCIGNDGKTMSAPVIGDNVEIGVGAKIIGNVVIADDIKIGAGAVVVTSFTEKGITIGGVPAKRIK